VASSLAVASTVQVSRQLWDRPCGPQSSQERPLVVWRWEACSPPGVGAGIVCVQPAGKGMQWDVGVLGADCNPSFPLLPGMMLGGGCGQELAHWIVHGRPEKDMYSYDIRQVCPRGQGQDQPHQDSHSWGKEPLLKSRQLLGRGGSKGRRQPRVGSGAEGAQIGLYDSHILLSQGPT
jgi:hypothetical protein